MPSYLYTRASTDRLSREELARFFAVPPRGLGQVLRSLGLRDAGVGLRWPDLWRSLGLAEEQESRHHRDLTEPLLPARALPALVGVESTSIIYRWEKGTVPAGKPPFPSAIDIGAGREGARQKRWRRAEILAWQLGRPLPRYAQAVPPFGTLLPVPARPPERHRRLHTRVRLQATGTQTSADIPSRNSR